MRPLRVRVVLLAGFVSLIAGMLQLAEHPLVGVLMMLGSMACLLCSTARLCKAQVRRSEFRNKEQITGDYRWQKPIQR